MIIKAILKRFEELEQVGNQFPGVKTFRSYTVNAAKISDSQSYSETIRRIRTNWKPISMGKDIYGANTSTIIRLRIENLDGKCPIQSAMLLFDQLVP